MSNELNVLPRNRCLGSTKPVLNVHVRLESIQPADPNAVPSFYSAVAKDQRLARPFTRLWIKKWDSGATVWQPYFGNLCPSARPLESSILFVWTPQGEGEDN